MKSLFRLLALSLLLAACGPEKPSTGNGGNSSAVEDAAKQNADPTKGIGQVKNVTLHSPLEQDRITRGLAIYEMKCQPCHKLTDQRFVGPGWQGVTQRRKPEWIMNMVTNVDVMLEQDEEARKLLELCLTRMPNQNISIGDARDVLEFMRQNDGAK